MLVVTLVCVRNDGDVGVGVEGDRRVSDRRIRATARIRPYIQNAKIKQKGSEIYVCFNVQR